MPKRRRCSSKQPTGKARREIVTHTADSPAPRTPETRGACNSFASSQHHQESLLSMQLRFQTAELYSNPRWPNRPTVPLLSYSTRLGSGALTSARAASPLPFRLLLLLRPTRLSPLRSFFADSATPSDAEGAAAAAAAEGAARSLKGRLVQFGESEKEPLWRGLSRANSGRCSYEKEH